MGKNILILSTSQRTGSNSDALAEEFAKGAREAGHTVARIRLPLTETNNGADAG